MGQMVEQRQQSEWVSQWQIFDGKETLFLFQDWIYPQTLEDFRGKKILEGGCGGGQHTAIMAPYATQVTAVDLNTIEVVRQRLTDVKNVSFVQTDIATMDLGRDFDIVISIGVVHHTDDPDKTVENLKRHVKKDGTIILWVYSEENNTLVRFGVEPLRKLLIKHLDRKSVLAFSKVLTVLLYVPVHTIYRLPLKKLPYYEYFGNFHKLSFNRNFLNVFDKLNAPQVVFLSQERVKSWFKDGEFELIHLSLYKGISWRVSARRRD